LEKCGSGRSVREDQGRFKDPLKAARASQRAAGPLGNLYPFKNYWREEDLSDGIFSTAPVKKGT